MPERMEIVETIYEGAVEPSYKKSTRVYAKHDGNSKKIR